MVVGSADSAARRPANTPAPTIERLQPPRASEEKRDRPEPAFEAGSVLVRFRADAGPAARASALARYGLRSRRDVAGTPFVLAETGSRHPREVAHALRGDAAVAEAQPNYIRRASLEPTDTLFRKRGGQAQYLAAVRLPEAWDVTQGSSGVTVAIVDTGVDADHPDLGGRVLPGRDVVNGDNDAADDEGHGTMVAGIAAAETSNAAGIAGAAGAVSILPVKVLDASGAGTDAGVAEGIVWAADQGADVINLSLGGSAESPVLRDAIGYAVARGAFVVAAAGNDMGPTPSYPAAYDSAFAVGATDASGNAAWFSNHGWWVDLAAPGIDILGPAPGIGAQQTYAVGSGTSFAAPLVAGAAALVLAQTPSLTPAAVAERLRTTARDAGPRGVDRSYGSGLLDAAAAVGLPRRPRSAQPATDANDSPDRSRTLSAASPVFDEAISPEGDADWFHIDIAAQSTLTVGVEPSSLREWVPRALEHDPVLELYGPDLRKLAEADEYGPGATERLSYQAAAGRYYLRVTNYAGSRTPTYTTSVTVTAPAPDRFAAPQSYPTGSSPSNVAIGDVTGDGRNDVLMTTGAYMGDEPGADYMLWVYEQDADGWLKPPVRHASPAGSPVGSLALADFDGDGKTDVASARAGIYFQRDGGLADPVPVHEHLTVSYQVEAADMTGDGRPDLIVNRGDYGIVLLTNGTAGWTSTPVTTTLGHREIELGDVTGDGRRDVITIRDNAVDVFARNADGTFAAAVTYTPASTNGWAWTKGLEVADVTGDGKLDAIIVFGGNRPASRLNVFPQTPTGTFAPPVVYGVDDIPESVEAADLNRDGRQDVVTLHGGWQRAGVFLQNAGGALDAGQYSRIPYASHYEPDGLAVGDFTGDGSPDVAIADSNNGLVAMRQLGGNWPAALPVWIRNTAPRQHEDGVATTTVPALQFGRAVDPASVSAETVQLVNADTGATVPASVSWDGATARIQPSAPLAAATAYRVRVAGVRDTRGATLTLEEALRFSTASLADTAAPETVFMLTPPPHTTNARGRFHFAATEPGSTYECRLDTTVWSACTSAFFVPSVTTPSGYSYGIHTFLVRAVDGAGNVDATPASYTWEVHQTGYPPNNYWANGTVAIGSNGSVSGSTLGAYNDTDEPAHAGNASGASVWYVWTAPASGSTTFDTVGSAFDTLLAVYTGTELRSLTEVASDDDSGGSGTSRVTFNAVAGTEYLVAVSGYVDGYFADEGAFTLRWSAPSSADTTSPTVTLTSPAAGSYVEGYTVLRADAADGQGVVKVEFLIDGVVAGWDRAAPYEYSWYTPLHADGAAALQARAYDSSGNVRTTPVTTAEVDNVGPETTITSGPSGTVATTSASFAFSASEAGATFRCSLDNAGFVPCTSPVSYSGLSEGYHRFEVYGTDARGHSDLSPALRTWDVNSRDSDPPTTTITQKPEGGTIKATTATFAFNADEPSTFECKLDQGAFEPCSSPTTYTGLAGGYHAFQVAATDTAGNREGYGPTWSWTIYQDHFAAARPLPGEGGTISESTAAATKESGEPNHAGNRGGRSIWYRFYAVRSGTVSLDTRSSNFDTLLAVYRGATVSALTAVASNDNSGGLSTSAVSFSAVAGTEYRIAIDGRNGRYGTAYLNWSAPAASPSPDTTPPSVSLSGPGTVAVTGTVTMSADASDAGGIARVEFLVDGAVIAIDTLASYATSWNTATRPDGYVTIAARAFDNAGNQATSSRQVQVDNTPPDTTITSGPPSTTSSADASFTFYASESPAWFQCSLDGSGYVGCDTPKPYTGLSAGTHTFRVRAVDGVNLTETTPAAYTWTISTAPDTTAPDTSITSGPSGTVTTTSASFEFSSTEGGSAFECRLDGAAYASCSSPASYSALAAGTHTFEVRARDAAGNVDASPASRTWTVSQPADTTPPDTTITSGPSGSVTATTATFEFTSTEAGSTFECRLDAGAFAACTSPRSYSALVLGTHSFEVRAKDGAGNLDATPASRAWTIASPSPVAPANDPFSGASTLSGTSGKATGTNVGATKESGEPNHAGSAGGKSVWYAWTATASGSLTIDTIGSDFDTTLGVYTGTTVSALTTLAGDDDSAGSSKSRVSLTVTSGTTYRIAVDGYGGAAGNVTLNWALGATTGIAHDAFAGARVLTDGSGTSAATTVGATKESGEPNHAGNAGGKSIWFAWTAPKSATVTVDTIGSSYDTLLAAYTGSAVNALTVRASNDDASALQSRISFSATAGTVYRIAVDGYNGASGSVTLNWSQP